MKIDSHLIARMAGVSQSTVSRSFTDPDKVSAKTRARVMEAADSLGYKPDRYASALRRKGTGTILLLHIQRGGDRYWTNIKRNYWIFAEALLSLTGFFEHEPYIFEIKTVHTLGDVKSEEMRDICDGLIVFDYVDESEAEYIRSWDLPYVLCHRTLHLGNYNHVAVDNRAGGRLQGLYLKERGCGNPVYLMNDEDPFYHDLRKRGFLEIYPDAPVISSFSTGEMRDLLSSLEGKEGCDGLAFINDMLLVQMVMQYLPEGRDLLGEYPLIGYDNGTVLQTLKQRPASIDIGIGDLYREAAGVLLALIRGAEGHDGPLSLVHKPALVFPNS